MEEESPGCDDDTVGFEHPVGVGIKLLIDDLFPIRFEDSPEGDAWDGQPRRERVVEQNHVGFDLVRTVIQHESQEGVVRLHLDCLGLTDRSEPAKKSKR